MDLPSHPARLLWAAILVGFGATGAPAQTTCSLSLAATHTDPARTQIWATTAGEKALFFTADLDVNTDGAARSYHPDDPRGERIALNNMGNAITRMFDAQGRDVTCSPRRGACFTRFIETFEAARDAGYDPDGHPRVETRHIIPWRFNPALGREAPCTIQSGPHAGYFVSQTAMIVDPDAGICDQRRYLDSLRMNAIVLPRRIDWRAQGVPTDGGDLVVLRDRGTHNVAFALVGDRGPAHKIGEGTVALAATLGGVGLAGTETFQEIKRLARPRVDYLIFPTRDVPRMTGGRFDQSTVDRLGREALEAFGGLARLEACASTLTP